MLNLNKVNKKEEKHNKKECKIQNIKQEEKNIKDNMIFEIEIDGMN